MAQLNDGVTDSPNENTVAASVQIVLDPAGTPVVHITGELDIANVELLRSAIEPIVSQGPKRLVLDLNGLSFMDSSAIAVFLGWNASICPVELRRPTPMVRRLIEIMGLTDTFNVES